MRNYLAVGAIALVLLLPSASFAATSNSTQDQLRAQISQLLALVSQLQAQLSQQQLTGGPAIVPVSTLSSTSTTTATSTVPISPRPILCPFGSQANYNTYGCDPIAPPHPILCPLGSHANYTTYTCDSDTKASISASPSAGTLPLTVHFSVTGAPQSSYSLDFGDGTSCSGTSCNLAHTYSKAGTFRATVSSGDQSAYTSITVLPAQCPIYNLPKCPVGQHLGPSSTDANGCTVPGQCVADTVTPPCPAYTSLECNANQHRGPSTTDAKGCFIPGICVANSCPLYPSVQCGGTQHRGPDSTDANGCTIPGKCVANAPFSVSCAVSPNTGTPNTIFTWTATASGGAGSGYSYFWSGTGQYGLTGNPISFSYGGGSATYSGVVTVTDSADNSSGAVACSNAAIVSGLTQNRLGSQQAAVADAAAALQALEAQVAQFLGH